MFDLAVTRGLVVTADHIRKMDGYIRDGEIAALCDGGQGLEAGRRQEVDGMQVFPGIIDCHAHFQTPGFAHMAGNPAKIFGLAGKGDIRPGMDADLVVVDLTRRWQVRAQDM